MLLQPWVSALPLFECCFPSTQLIMLSQGLPFTNDSNPTDSCQVECSIHHHRGDVFGWWDSRDKNFFNQTGHVLNPQPPITKTLTATVVTVVNTISNITSVGTVMPSDWVAPPTNAAGTQIQSVTYFAAGAKHTTTMYDQGLSESIHFQC